MVCLTHLSGKIKCLTIILMVLMLNACATQNSSLRSPTANSTESIDQINQTLDEALTAKKAPTVPEIPDSVMAALTPTLASGKYLSKGVVKKSETRFDIAVKNLPAKDFFEGLVEGTRQNIVVHPDVKGKISLQLKDVTIADVLDITKEIYGYDFDQNDRLIKVYPAGVRTQIFAINYLNVKRDGQSNTHVSSGQITQNTKGNSSGGSSASNPNVSSSSKLSNYGGSNGGGEGGSSGGTSQRSGSGTEIFTENKSDFWGKLQQILQLIVGDKSDYSVVVMPVTGMVVVKADSNTLSEVELYLQKAQLIIQRQVILEAKILEVSLSKGYQQGVDWNFSQASKSLDSKGNPLRGIGIAQVAKNIASGGAGGVFASTVKLGNFNTTISLLGTQGNVQVLSSPRIATVNNQKAVIKVGNDEYFVTDVRFQSNNVANLTSTDIDLTPFFSGIALDVTPQISKDGKIILHVHPTISKVIDQQKVIDLGGKTLNLPLAFSSIRESDSIITAENGQIVVIGGLIQNRNADNNSSVPFLGDIPFLGELFKQKHKDTEKTELVILLRATVTDDKSTQQDIRSSRQRFGDFRDRMNAPTETSFY